MPRLLWVERSVGVRPVYLDGYRFLNRSKFERLYVEMLEIDVRHGSIWKLTLELNLATIRSNSNSCCAVRIEAHVPEEATTSYTTNRF